MRNKLNEEQKKDALNKLPGWSLVLNKESITKTYIFIFLICTNSLNFLSESVLNITFDISKLGPGSIV